MKKAPNHPIALGALALFLTVLFTCPSKASPSAESSNPAPLAEELRPLQGHWEGEGAGGKCTITILGNSLVYTNSGGWFKTTFTLPAGVEPRQLHATIKECSPPSKDSIGAVVFALFKIEDGTLLLGTYGESAKPPKSLEATSDRYTVKKVQPQKKKAEPSPSK
jgi:hypothetical protein